VSGNTLTFNPNTDFKAGETVVATVSAAAQSSGGVAAEAQVFQFTTATTPSLGTFAGGSTVAVGVQPNGVVVGDIDGDGDLDLLTANNVFGAGTVSVRRNDGQGNFSGSQELAGIGNSPTSLALGDVDNDGDLDILTANQNSGAGSVSVLFNNGTGSFSFRYPGIDIGGDLTDIAVGDVDADGDLDFATTSTGFGNSISIRLNNGQGVFTGTQQVAANGFATTGIVFGDVDGDGDLDLLTANIGSNTVSLRLNNGQGGFSGTQEVAVGNGPLNVALGDVDGDGDLDLATPNINQNTVSVRLNNGQGSFSGSQEVVVGATPVSVSLGDVDGNGTLDMVTANNTGNTVSVRLNQAPAAVAVLGMAPAWLTEHVTLYPNPAHDMARLLLPAGLTQQPVQVQLINAVGEVVREQQVPAKAAVTSVELSVRDLAQGLYLVRVRTSQGFITKRLLVE
jgi:hypothetical protein